MPGPAENNSHQWIDVLTMGLFLLLSLSITSGIVTSHFYAYDLLAWMPKSIPGRALIGWLFVITASSVWLLNFWLHFLNPWRHKRKHGTLSDYKGPSGLPGVGTLLCGLATVVLPPSPVAGVILLIILLTDMGGLPRFQWIIFKDWWRKIILKHSP